MDLKSFRESELKLTQEEFANLIGVDIIEIIKMEEDPSEIKLPIIQKIAKETGRDFNSLLLYEKVKIECLIPEYTWEKSNYTKKTLIDYLKKGLESEKILENEKEEYIQKLTDILNLKLNKPKIAIVGRSDTGKSTLINSLLGVEKMPVSWTPTTSIAVYIKHISDKPTFMKENTWIFSNDIKNKKMWDEKKLYDEEYCNKWKIISGDIDILQTFGTRQGDKSLDNAGAAVVFLNSPILKNCDIIDLPGFGTDLESDTDITFNISQKADIIVYLSQANGFMRIEDIEYLKANIVRLPVLEEKERNALSPLCNLFIVASQANNINNGNEKELSVILENGYKSFIKTLSNRYWNERKNISGYFDEEYNKMLETRFFTYTTDIPRLCEKFNKELKNVIETLPLLINNRAKEYIKKYIKENNLRLEKEMESYNDIINKRDEYINLINEIEKNELNRKNENDKKKKNIIFEIQKLSQYSKNNFLKEYSELIEINNLKRLLKEQKIKNKKEDIQKFGSYIITTLQEKAKNALELNSEKLSKQIEDYIINFNKGLKFKENAININFDAKWEFLESLENVAKYGAIGGLGGILAGVGLVFTPFPLIGGFAFLFSPLGIIVGLASFLTLGAINAFGIWEEKVAKKLIENFEKKEVIDKFNEIIESFWNDTEKAFIKANEEFEKKWKDYVKELNETVNSYDIDKIKEKLNSLSKTQDFFNNIPL